MLAPPARIVRRTGSQRELTGRRDATVAAWRTLAGEADEGRARALVEAQLPTLAARLWRSPYWCRVLQAEGLSPRDLDSLAALERFPGLARGDLDESLVALAPGDEPVVVRSSGTSGNPVRVVKDRWDSLVMWAALAFWLERCGVTLPPRPRVVLLDSLPGGLEYSVRLRLVGDGGGALHRVSLVRGEARAQERLRRLQPAVIFSDPDGLHALARMPTRAPLLLTSAQRFAPAARAAFAGTPIVNYYATTETGPIAWECLAEPERFHVLAPEMWVESVDGELRVTRLRDSVLPLCRYRTGDAGRVVREAGCSCGWNGWSIVDFNGRRACCFVTPAGARVDAWSLAWLFKQHPLRAFRLVQTLPEAFALRFDGDPAAAAPLAAQLAEALVLQGWPRATLRIVTEVGPLVTPALKPAPFACEFVPAGGAAPTRR